MSTTEKIQTSEELRERSDRRGAGCCAHVPSTVEHGKRIILDLRSVDEKKLSVGRLQRRFSKDDSRAKNACDGSEQNKERKWSVSATGDAERRERPASAEEFNCAGICTSVLRCKSMMCLPCFQNKWHCRTTE